MNLKNQNSWFQDDEFKSSILESKLNREELKLKLLASNSIPILLDDKLKLTISKSKSTILKSKPTVQKW